LIRDKRRRKILLDSQMERVVQIGDMPLIVFLAVTEDRKMKRHFGFKLVVTVLVAVALVLGNAWAKRPGDKPPPGGGKKEKTDHSGWQERPIQLGVSGGSVTDITEFYCCSGTLGALVEDDTGQYILSNTHVLAGDMVSGSNGAAANAGDLVTQPGYVDVGCAYIEEDGVALLTDWVDLVPGGTSLVDAAIAEVIPGKVDPDGRILGIGTIPAETVAPFIKQAVKKSGRTSGVTKGRIAAIDVTVSVEYTYECAGDTFVSTFTGQILVTPGRFLKPGDSGSLMVENARTDPRPVGLLYAGSSTVAVANPIDDVLSALGVTIVGVPSSASATASSTGGSAPVGLARASQAKAKHADILMSVPGAIGHAVGLSDGPAARPVVKILLEKITPAAERAYPRQIDGTAVELWEVGKIVAY